MVGSLASIQDAPLQIVGKFWKWLTSREFEVEHIAMFLVIGLSTWHVGHYMHQAEGSGVIAGAMGLVLGLCNALFAMRFFEANGSHRWPAGIGMLFFAAASTWLQYGFYSENDGVTMYAFKLFGATVNFNAFVQGAWAPAAELLVGWEYGTRLKDKKSLSNVMDSLRKKMQQEIDQLTGKFTTSLRTEQALRDDIQKLKTDHSNVLVDMREIITKRESELALLQSKVDGLLAKLHQSEVESAGLKVMVSSVKSSAQNSDQSGGKSSGKLSTTDRRLKVKQLAGNDGATVSGIASTLGVSRNTVRADLAFLEIKLSAAEE